MDDSIARLSESISQHAATALINLKIPEFSGSPQQDVNKFISDFKFATLTLNDELRCLALQRSLIGPAKVWAKVNIKQEMLDGDWSAAKSKLRQRFLAPGQELRQLDKLAKMKYDPLEMTLSSYVETFADLYKRVHPNASEAGIIQGIRLNLTPDILRHLNIISDSWTTFTTLNEFLTLVTRVERDILPYEIKPKVDENANLTAIAAALKEIREIATARRQPEESHPQTIEVLAAVAPQTRGNDNSANKRQHQDDNYDSNNNQFKRQYNWPRPPRNTNDNQGHEPTDAQRRYETKHGKVPYPCRTCRGMHFHRHCPYHQQDLN